MRCPSAWAAQNDFDFGHEEKEKEEDASYVIGSMARKVGLAQNTETIGARSRAIGSRR